MNGSLSREGSSGSLISSVDDAGKDRNPSPNRPLSESGTSNEPICFNGETKDLSNPWLYQMNCMDPLISLLMSAKRELEQNALKLTRRRADDVLQKDEEAYHRLKTSVGEEQALNNPDVGHHERYRGYLLKTYFQGESRIAASQQRLIEANVIRRNRLIFALRTTNGVRGTIPSNTSHAPSLDVHLLPGSGNNIHDHMEEVTVQLTTNLVLAPNRARSVAARDDLDCSECPAESGFVQCPFCRSILPRQYTDGKRWG